MTFEDLNDQTFGTPYAFLDYLEDEAGTHSELFYGSREIKQSADTGEVREFFELLEVGREIWFSRIRPEIESKEGETLVNAEVSYHSIDDYLPIAGYQEITMKFPGESRKRVEKVITD